MPEFRNMGDQTSVDGVNPSDEVIAKVGRAVGQVTAIGENYRDGLAIARSDAEKQELARQAEEAAVQAISDQGLSIAQYNRVVAAADDDPALEERLLEAAQAR